ncbi:MAG: hypothetical protein ACHQTE_00720 [Candidatus Saccharimonadales bacterium]
MTTQEKLHTTIESEQDMNQVIRSLKEVQIVDQAGAYPYRDSTIELEDMALSNIRPLALYIVRHALARQFIIRSDLQRLGRDSLRLGNALRISYDGDEVSMIPPIVEDTADGLCLMDGLHRSMMARSIGETTIRVLRITNIDSAYPLTSYPNEWDEIRMYEATPTDRALKKKYRSDGHFFRDLSAINGSRRREGGHAA